MTMVNESGSSFVSADEVEGIPAVASSGSCVVSVTSNGGCGTDGTSVGSNSTKTRFSFYNAQEVQMEEQSHQNNSSKRKEDESTAKKSTPTKQNKEDGYHNSNHNSINHPASSDQRFNFYVAAGGTTTATNSSSSPKEDDRRSPHSLLVTEDDDDTNDNKRTPAVVTTESNATTSHKLALSIKTSTPTPKQALTPQRNNTVSSSAQKKKHRAQHTAAARARSHSKSDNRLPTPAANNLQSEDNQDEDDNNSTKMDSVEILRSLKDTEQMRFNLMKECHPKQNNSSHDAESASDTQEYVDAAEEYMSDSNHDYLLSKEQPPDAYRAHQDYVHSLQRPATTIPPDHHTAATSTIQGNPYEDAIREALDLLRKHRPPSPGPSDGPRLLQQQQQHEQSLQPQQSHLAIDMNVVHGATDFRTPRDADRVLQSRWESPHHQNAEEIDARRKERQERMARYTSRLAEIKGEPMPYHSDLHRPASTIDEGEEDSRLSIDQTFDQALASKSSFASQNRGMPSPGMEHVGIPSPCPSGDLGSLASFGTASSLSASHIGSSNQKEVHRSVERVLLAILERAHSNGRGTQAIPSLHNNASSASSNGYAPEPTLQASWQLQEEKKSSSDDRVASSSNPFATGQVQPQQQHLVEDDPLLRAVGELLSTSCGGSTASSGGSPVRPSDHTEQSSLTSGAKRSVVEELLAEAESFGDVSNLPYTHKASQPSSSTQSWNDMPKPAADLLNCSTGVEAVRSESDASAAVMDKDLDDLVMKTLGKSPSKSSNADASTDGEDDTGDYDETSPSGSYDEEEDDGDNSYDDDDSHVETDEDLDDALEGVLGPLSKTGGTTGVVLESSYTPASPDRSHRSNGERSIFDSLSNAMSSLVASAISGDEKHPVPSNQNSTKGLSLRDKYATDMDSDEHAEEPSSSASEDLDAEASELMRTLCAHLLPFGVDQSSRLLDEVPHWDDSNPNEAGYRIIRLTSLQLQRVEHAFESMVHGLKKHSEQNLMANSQTEGSNGDIDAIFERDLAAAEKALGEEENRTTAIMKALKLHPKDAKNQIVNESGVPPVGGGDDDGESVDASVESHPDVCHPDFPGIHSAGKGEMGDLEYFHLPVIFKSHVTGFEPTKDLFLEPGNVVAGQYLVESELGSAAFSTAYRCVDLNSEGDDTEDVSLYVFLVCFTPQVKNSSRFVDHSAGTPRSLFKSYQKH
jgi:hypothetical protein